MSNFSRFFILKKKLIKYTIKEEKRKILPIGIRKVISAFKREKIKIEIPDINR
ncbi:MAG: hypothetical protein ABWJ98_00770 [Hydrogenothermaceae bacterium]